ncbi:MAG: FKBP-type peptidyl-prolyl cis-trans isomerase [Gammaproteobacteria bacterium]|nr:FKBP-type peptidyl-prolyl cis-trans isomerase [Gammaproteobacteria bacterium]
MSAGKILILVAALGFVAFYLYNTISAGQKAEYNRQIGTEFLTKNKQQDGVVETDSGLQYLILEERKDSSIHPKPVDTVKVHYHGTLIDGTVFDSSVDRGTPISFPLNRVISGWTEGLQLMTVGDKFRLFIPADLAYGNKAAGKIGPGSTLIFDVELLGINES